MIAILLADGFEEIEALTPLDILRRANLDVKSVSINANREVTGAHGIRLFADLTKNDVNLACVDFVIFPGGMPGAKNLDESEFTDEILKAVLENGGRIGAICAAPMILGKRGLLRGKRACSYPGFEGELHGAFVSYEPTVVDGNIITARGMGAALDFSFAVISEILGKDAAQKLSASVIYEVTK